MTVLSQGHDQTVPNGAKNGRLHTPSGHNNDTNPSRTESMCAFDTIVYCLIQRQKDNKTKQKQSAVFCSMNYRNKKTLTEPVLLDLLQTVATS